MTHDAALAPLLRNASFAFGLHVPPDLFHKEESTVLNTASRRIKDPDRSARVASLPFLAGTPHCAEFLDSCLRSTDSLVTGKISGDLCVLSGMDALDFLSRDAATPLDTATRAGARCRSEELWTGTAWRGARLADTLCLCDCF